MSGGGSHPEQGRPVAGELFEVLDVPLFRKRYPPETLRPRALHTERVARGLRERLGMRSVLGVAFYPWHDQTTLWWFEQGLITLLAATGWETTWVTDARYAFDDARLGELDHRVSIVRQHRDSAEWQPPAGRFDAVVALFPCDQATRAARALGAELITFAIKNVHQDEPILTEAPPPGTPLWHAFAGSQTFHNGTFGPFWNRIDTGHLGSTAAAWRLMGAPFPVNRYYFPWRPATPVFDALLFGSKARDYDTVMAALHRAGAGRIAALANLDDRTAVEQAARRHGVDVAVHDPMSHLRLLELLERTRLVVNPITPPDESHYSLSVPLALGRPIVATDLPSVRPFAGPGVRLAPQGDVAAWADSIGQLLSETAAELPHRGALKQGVERHDVDRFFASAILASLGATTPSG